MSKSEIKLDTATTTSSLQSVSQLNSPLDNNNDIAVSNTNKDKDIKKPTRRRRNRDRKHTKSLNIDSVTTNSTITPVNTDQTNQNNLVDSDKKSNAQKVNQNKCVNIVAGNSARDNQFKKQTIFTNMSSSTSTSLSSNKTDSNSQKNVTNTSQLNNNPNNISKLTNSSSLNILNSKQSINNETSNDANRKKNINSNTSTSTNSDSTMKKSDIDNSNSKKIGSVNKNTNNEPINASIQTINTINTNTRQIGTNKSVTVSVLQNNSNEPNSSQGNSNYNNNTNVNNMSKPRTVYSNNSDHHQQQQINQQHSRQSNNSESNSEFLFKNIMELEKNFVYKMKNASSQHENAKYRCTICNYFCNTIDIARKHINGTIHKNNFETIKLEMRIRELEMPPQYKLEYLSSYLVDFYLKNSISPSQIKKRYDIYFKFKQKFLDKYPDAIVNMYGSTAYGICFNDSSCDVSIEFETTSTGKPKTTTQILALVNDLIRDEMSEIFYFKITNQNSNKNSKNTNQNFNKLTVESIDSKIVFNFTTGLFSSAHKTATLLRCYFELDERAKILAFCFRYIAKLAQIDKVDLCTLPSHSYAIMSIYFLQQLNPPVLPILHEIINSKKLTTKKKPNTDSAISTAIDNKKIDSSELIKTNFNKQRNYSEKLLKKDSSEDFEEAEYDYDTIDNFNVFKKNLQEYINGKNWTSSNNDNVGTLWLKLLTFYSIDFGFKKTFISVRKHKRISKSKVKMYTKKMAIEDPFSLKQSLSRNLLTQTNKYIINVFSKSCLYFVMNTQCYTDPTSLEIYPKEEKYKIVDKLVAETGILDAKKTNSEFDEDYEDVDEVDAEAIDNVDQSNNFQTEYSVDDDDEQDLYYLKKNKTSKNKNSSTKTKRNSKQSESENVGKLSKEVDVLLKVKSRSDDHLDQNPSLFLSIETGSSTSTTPVQENEIDEIEVEDEVEQNLDDDDSEKFTQEEEENDEEDDDEEEDYKNHVDDIETDSEECDELFLEHNNLDNKNSLNIKASADDFEYAAKNCLVYLIKRVIEINETFYEHIPNVMLIKTQNKFSIVNKTKNQQGTNGFRFSASSLGFAKSPPLICTLCNKDGHLQVDCPQDRLPKLEDLPCLTDQWKKVLDNVCTCIMDDNVQSKKEENDRNTLFKQIKAIVSQKFPEAKLSLFGSSNNGFAMKNSDLDICMTLENCSDKDKMALNFKKIIRTLGGLFRRESQEFDMIEERVSAKVPIVKFRHRKTMIEGDISLYNTLALQNTDLLRAYAEIDHRTKILGHTVKYFAKICRIGDASCGSLSSYAYIVMMIHYLMNTSPPVLPCLQNLNKENLPKSETNVNIDGWDCWFNRDIKNLDKLWPQGYKANQQSVGELWLGFLRYYTETFDWENHVVCIRENSEYLTRKNKNWTKYRLAIEDPFELTHNLAAGVSPKMGLYILKSFMKARLLFGQIIDEFKPMEIRFNMDYFFNPKSLVEGSPPMDRNCFSCFKIGHQTKDCPMANRQKKDRQQQQNNNSNNNQFNIENNNENNLNSIECYRCKNYGHIARDCPMTSEQLNSKRQKTLVNLNNNVANKAETTGPRCFKCNQMGHFCRECPENNYIVMNKHHINTSTYQNQILTQQAHQKQSTNSIINQQNQYQLQFQQHQFQQPGHKIKQQSAPPPKIITIINPSSKAPINAPIVLKSGDNVQLLVNSSHANNSNLTTNLSSSSTSSSASSPSSANSESTNSNKNNQHKNSLLHNQPQNYQQQMQIILQRQQSHPNQSTNNNNNNTVSTNKKKYMQNY